MTWQVGYGFGSEIKKFGSAKLQVALSTNVHGRAGGGLRRGVSLLPRANRKLAAEEGGVRPHAFYQASEGQARFHQAQQNSGAGRVITKFFKNKLKNWIPKGLQIPFAKLFCNFIYRTVKCPNLSNFDTLFRH